MRISVNWLRTLVADRRKPDRIAEIFTRGGLEAGSVETVAPAFSGVLVAEVVAVEPHPKSGRLRICEVNYGRKRTIKVVCGAPNVRTGMKSAVALAGARLAGGVAVNKTRIREVLSAGMLCSPAELGLDDDEAGILELEPGVEPGKALDEVLGLDDSVIELELTPNRGDCLGMLGVARDYAALTGATFRPPTVRAVAARSREKITVKVEARADCPRFAGRVITRIDVSAPTPAWMRERLTKAGIRCINAVVDITNYVMIERGQPMHAFDRNNIDTGIVVRRACPGETLVLLDEREVKLDEATLVIADHHKAIALAGIMGGEHSGINEGTRDIVFEAAFFSPGHLAGRARLFGLHTDASHRFERGVDPGGQVSAIERATRLLVDICGGVPGPVTEVASKRYLPVPATTNLRPARVSRLLGLEVPEERVEGILRSLDMKVRRARGGWRVTPPAFRFDVTGEHDLIEELTWFHGYDRVPVNPPGAPGGAPPPEESRLGVGRLRSIMVDRDYFEAVTYSFVDSALNDAFGPKGVKHIALRNPISANLDVMRSSQLPSLVQALSSNFNRQHRRIRLFECGKTYHIAGGERVETWKLSAVATGSRYQEQWSVESRPMDFYDIKGDVEALLAAGDPDRVARFRKSAAPGFHPGQCASVFLGRNRVGVVGRLAPETGRELEIDQPVYGFEIDLDSLRDARIPSLVQVSRFPASRRDLALVVDQDLPAADLVQAVEDGASDHLKDIHIFDIYRGQGVEGGRKSVALGLTFQSSSRTLTDTEVDKIVRQLVDLLAKKYQATLRT